MDPMLRKALCNFRRLRDQLDNLLLGEDGDVWEAELRKFVAKRPCWVECVEDPAKQQKKKRGKESVLEFISTVVISATTTKFIANEMFVRDTSCKAKVKISHLDSDFISWFLSGDDGKTEDPIAQQTLRYAKLLRKSSPNNQIIVELGGKAKAETTLTELWSLMKFQANGEEGALLNNGWANAFYIKDVAGVLRAVCVGWSDVGWFVGADSVEIPHVWFDGYRVFSRNS